MLDVDNFDSYTFVSVRLGDDAYTCRGADVIFAFEHGSSALLFQNLHSSSTSPISNFSPACAEDFEYLVRESGEYIVYETSFVEGMIAIALPSWCANYDNLLAVANETSLGWGIQHPENPR